MKRIYFDNSATTPLHPEILKDMIPYYSNNFGNASSVHKIGRISRHAVEESRKTIAKFLNCNTEEIIFTSGGTESDNLAIKGLITAISSQYNDNVGNSVNKLPHIITSAFEHHAVLDTCLDLEKRKIAEVTYIKPNKNGVIETESIKKSIKTNTVLVSIMYVNNEVGTLQPIKKISELIGLKNEIYNTTKINKDFGKIYFHTDAIQAVKYQDCNTKRLGIDLMSVSAHKFNGPKGIGFLYVRKGTPLHHELIGGSQEFSLRAGTENTPHIVGMAKAIEKLFNSSRISRVKKTQELKDYFLKKILKEIPDTTYNGSYKFANPNILNVTFKYIEGESILIHLDLEGIAASTGSACTSGTLEPSHVLLSMGLKEIDAHGSIRFSLSEDNTREEIDYTIKKLIKIIKKLRKISPYTPNI